MLFGVSPSRVSGETPEIARGDACAPQPKPVNHLIHRVRVELRTNTRVAAIAAQEAASRALQDDLDAVEAAFDTRFPEDTTLRLDRLEVELGPLPVRGFRQAFIAALVQSLTGIDAKVIPSRPGVRISEFPRSSQWKAKAAAGTAESNDAVEVFLHYVTHGSLPWFFPLERWRDEIPKVLMSREAFSALRLRLSSLVLEEPARLLRLVSFPSLVSALFSLEFPVAKASAASVAEASLPPGPFRGRIKLALWFFRLTPEPAAKVEDAKAEMALLDLLAGDRGRSAAIELRDSQSIISALAALRKAAKSPEIERLSRLVKRAARQVSDFRVTGRMDFAKPERFDATEDQAENGVPTESAGIVLLHPFLIRFFQLFGWLDDRLHILDKHRWYAAHAMHWIVHKHPARDEVDLVLEKALCGIPLGEIACWPELEYKVKEEADALLRAVIAHWQALKDTSPDGLREAFLARPGLFYPVEPPRLHVETRAYDVLLSRLPWSFDRIALPWLRSPIQVRWQKPS